MCSTISIGDKAQNVRNITVYYCMANNYFVKEGFWPNLKKFCQKLYIGDKYFIYYSNTKFWQKINN